MEAPKRRYTMTIEIGADDYDTLLSALEDWILKMRLYNPDLSENHSGVMGGSTSGYSYDILVDQDMTHDKYVDLIREYLGNRKTDNEGER